MTPGDPSAAFARLAAVVRRLRAPGGCPWDREQTPHSLRGSLVEEAWEAVAAVDAGDTANLREELGDLALVVTMIAAMQEEAGAFDIAAVLDGASEKLVRRHPHVFGDAAARTARDVLAHWDAIKAREKAPPAGGASLLDHVGRGMPPLERALRLQKKAAKAGFDWPDAGPVHDKVAEEMRELREAADGEDRARVEEEAGDLLFTVVNLARLLQVDPSVALAAANEKFERRFRAVERELAAEGVRPEEAGLARMDRAWNAAKEREGGRQAQAPPGGPQSASK